MSEPFATTVVERYFARASHGVGMVFGVSLLFRGTLDRERLKAAWFDTVAQHDRLHGRMIGRGRDRRWQPVPVHSESFIWQPEEASTIPNRPRAMVEYRDRIDLSNGIGACCVVERRTEHQHCVHVLFHHSCCDGVGATRIVGQLIKAYRRVLRPTEPTAEAVVGNPTRERATERREMLRGRVGRPKVTLPDPANVWTTIRGTNVRLKRHLTPTDDATLTSDPIRLTLCQSVGRSIRDRLRERQISMNDFGVAITLFALAKVTSHARSRRRHCMVMNPVEMRQWHQRRETNNHIGFAYVRRRHDDLRDLDSTLSSVAEQMNGVRRLGIAGELAAGMAIAERCPGALWAMERSGIFTPTASLTCLSSVRFGKRFGLERGHVEPRLADAVLEDVEITGPVQARGELGITMWSTDERLCVQFQSNPNTRQRGRHSNCLPPSSLRTISETWARLATEFAQSVCSTTELIDQDDD